MRPLLVLVPLVLAGCATHRGEADLFGMPEIRTVTTGSVNPGGESGATTYRYESQPVLVEEVVQGGMEEALPALVAALRSEGLGPDDVDTESGVVSSNGLEWSRERNGERLSALLDCGTSGTGRPMADDARIAAALAAHVQEAGPASAKITLRLAAVANPYESLGGRVRECVTTGVLERAVLRRVAGALAPAETPSGVGPVVPAVPASPPTLEGAAPGLVPGHQVRVWLASGERVTGAFLQARSDSLVLGTSRRTSIPLGLVERAEVKRTRRLAVGAAALVGIVAGVTIATTTDWGIVGKHKIQGEMLNPGLGAIFGGIAGILVANGTFGTSWVEVPLERLRLR